MDGGGRGDDYGEGLEGGKCMVDVSDDRWMLAKTYTRDTL